MTAFWDIMLCSLITAVQCSEVLTASVIRAMSKLHTKKQLDQGLARQSKEANERSGKPSLASMGEDMETQKSIPILITLIH
jgi:hypothetical protein